VKFALEKSPFKEGTHAHICEYFAEKGTEVVCVMVIRVISSDDDTYLKRDFKPIFGALSRSPFFTPRRRVLFLKVISFSSRISVNTKREVEKERKKIFSRLSFCLLQIIVISPQRLNKQIFYSILTPPPRDVISVVLFSFEG
jgi:hypothetical protein